MLRAIVKTCFYLASLYLSTQAVVAEPVRNFGNACHNDIIEWIKENAPNYNIAGVSLTILIDSKKTCQFYFGNRDKKTNKPVNDKTLFNAASISKPISALAALKLFKQHKIEITDPINNYLVHWKLKGPENYQPNMVTLVNLLSHSAGISGFRCKGYKRNQAFPTLLQTLNGILPANTPKVTMVAKPNTQFLYSPAAYMILQQLIEDITNHRFAKVMQRSILDPLNMNHSTFLQPLPKSYFSNVAFPYLPNGKLVPGGPLSFAAAAAGGLWTTSSDLIKFINFIRSSNISNKTKTMGTEIIKNYLRPTFSNNWGLGIQINLNNYGDEVTQGDYFGHGGFNSGYVSFMLGHSKKPVGFAVLVNTAPLMTTKGEVVQYDFIKKLNKEIARSYNWP